ncbi:TerC family protein [Marinactinospora thermotolerans]|uniref:Membrane protein TerC, possibly involved in tellurium resistance n=1 Tax=Marinactinospora thermotolerans DSM 45154 TaxID=1122192 RepID=A0A1T4SL08_9ACTN|nr:TerC family protein [Marinactinospora thermotolerans]SKA28877.1 Membrane protein TerC, possibly involved in tellurium resistance [Marinactinospora thermotolerans DSM 45154]
MPTDLIVGFFTLTLLEIVLGIDNLVFISILSSKLPEHQRDKARKLGIGLALITRLALLGSISWIIQLTEPLFSIGDMEFSGQSLILLVGGFFLLAKGTYEIHESLEGEEDHKGSKVGAAFGMVVTQIVALDLVFSLDSVITAVGMIDPEGAGIWVMVAAVVIAVIVMLVSANPLSKFVHDHPTVKMLALAFLLLIGMSLVAEGFGFHIEKGFIYTAMGFSLFVEILNLLAARRRRKRSGAQASPVKLASRYAETPATGDAGAVAAADAVAPREAEEESTTGRTEPTSGGSA